MIRAPEAPKGCPRATAPPRGFRIASATGTPPATPAEPTRTPRSPRPRRCRSRQSPARASTLWVAGIGPVSISERIVPDHARRVDPGPGPQPQLAAISSLISSSAAAPSVICDELPAVTFHSISGKRSAISGVPKTAFSPASRSTVVSGRIDSSALDLGPRRPSPSRPRRRTPPAARPPPPARASAPHTRRARTRERPHLSATSSAETPCGTRPGNRSATPAPHGSAPDPRGPHRDPAHRLDAARDDDVVGAGDDPVGRELDSLLAGSALPLDGRRRHVDGEPGGEPRLPTRRRGLLTGLADAADHDVLDGARVDPGAFDEGGEDLSEQVGRVQPGQGTARFAASHRGADGVDDDCAGHGRPPGRSPINDHG